MSFWIHVSCSFIITLGTITFFISFTLFFKRNPLYINRSNPNPPKKKPNEFIWIVFSNLTLLTPFSKRLFSFLFTLPAKKSSKVSGSFTFFFGFSFFGLPARLFWGRLIAWSFYTRSTFFFVAGKKKVGETLKKKIQPRNNRIWKWCLHLFFLLLLSWIHTFLFILVIRSIFYMQRFSPLLT